MPSTGGDTQLPAGEFIARAPADVAWLVAEVTRLRCRDAMATALHQLLAQLPAEPGDTAAEEVLATQASELAEKATEFAAQLIRRQPARAVACEIYRLAAQIVETADIVDDHRGY
ncbi:hypothetical protein [Streptomyces kanasensis]|uniref:hypothetical protein n=1 Tax=Streptomyces kanasensis TaxID=936756 RepID=UPI003829159F